MGGRFDDNWLDDSYESTTDEFIPADPFDGIQKRDQDLFFRMLDIIPDDKRKAAMEYFVSNPRKIREVIKVMKIKKKIIDDRDMAKLRTVFSEYRVNFDEADTASTKTISDADDLEDDEEEKDSGHKERDEYEEDEY